MKIHSRERFQTLVFVGVGFWAGFLVAASYFLFLSAEDADRPTAGGIEISQTVQDYEDLLQSCSRGNGESCLQLAEVAHQMPDASQRRLRWHWMTLACQHNDEDGQMWGCRELLDSGNTRLRNTACVKIEEKCQDQNGWSCEAYRYRCEVVRTDR